MTSLLVVTGTIHIEGGERNTVVKSAKRARGGRIVLDRKVSADRLAANVITTDWMRRLRGIALMRTPFGVLVEKAKRAELDELIAHTDQRIREYAKAKRTCRVSNCVVVEELCCERQRVIEAWAKRVQRERAVKPLLTAMGA